MPVSRLNLGRGGTGAIEALGTALRGRTYCGDAQQRNDHHRVQKAPAAKNRDSHCANSSSAKRKTQRTPITCQYHTAESTTTCRVAICLE